MKGTLDPSSRAHFLLRGLSTEEQSYSSFIHEELGMLGVLEAAPFRGESEALSAEFYLHVSTNRAA